MTQYKRMYVEVYDVAIKTVSTLYLFSGPYMPAMKIQLYFLGLKLAFSSENSLKEFP